MSTEQPIVCNRCGNDFKYYTELDDHPMTGDFHVNFFARAVVKPWTECFFNGSPSAEQVTNITPGRVYKIYMVNCWGDVSDFVFIDDNDDLATLGSFFFEDVIYDETIIDKFNSIGCTSFQMDTAEIEKNIKSQEGI